MRIIPQKPCPNCGRAVIDWHVFRSTTPYYDCTYELETLCDFAYYLTAFVEHPRYFEDD